VVNVTSDKNTAGVGHCTLVSAFLFSSHSDKRLTYELMQTDRMSVWGALSATITLYSATCLLSYTHHIYFRLSVCYFFRTISQKSMQLGSPNLIQNVPILVLETHLFWSQKVKGQGHESQKHYQRGSLHCCVHAPNKYIVLVPKQFKRVMSSAALIKSQPISNICLMLHLRHGAGEFPTACRAIAIESHSPLPICTISRKVVARRRFFVTTFVQCVSVTLTLFEQAPVSVT